MQLFNTTIESWTDVQYIVRQKGFRFSELWNYKQEFLQMAYCEEFFSNDTILGLTQEMKQMVLQQELHGKMFRKTGLVQSVALQKMLFQKNN